MNKIPAKWRNITRTVAVDYGQKYLHDYDKKAPEEQESTMQTVYRKLRFGKTPEDSPKTMDEAIQVIQQRLELSLKNTHRDAHTRYTKWLIDRFNEINSQKGMQISQKVPKRSVIGGYFPFLEECYINVQNAIEDARHNGEYPLKVRFSDQSYGTGDEVHHHPTCSIGSADSEIDLKGEFVLPRKEMGADGSGKLCNDIYDMLNRVPDFGIERGLYRMTKRERNIEIDKG